jgi:uncharacterized protein (TIGR00730 family)
MLTVYLGSAGRARPVFKEAAQQLGALIGESGRMLVYGGMDAGLMGILASAALKAGAHVTGIIPRKIKDSERILPGLSETIMVDDLCDRKKQMFLMADAVLALPGGYGTLDESLEVLYWGGLGLHGKVLVLINIDGYWDPLIAYLKTLPDFDARFLLVVGRVEDAIPALEAHTPIRQEKRTPPHLPHFEDEITRGTDTPILIDRASIENTYFLICALGLKQLAKTTRPIGILNSGGQFDGLLEWIHSAAREHFITEKCLELFDVDTDSATLTEKLARQQPVIIDLHTLKWGAPATTKSA